MKKDGENKEHEKKEKEEHEKKEKEEHKKKENIIPKIITSSLTSNNKIEVNVVWKIIYLISSCNFLFSYSFGWWFYFADTNCDKLYIG